jgi:hypothetical protein
MLKALKENNFILAHYFKDFSAYWGVKFEPIIAQRLFVAHSLHFLILFYTIKKITKGVHK